ncbi:hypothetical protein [Natronorubrum sulfidifaciens]|uniref:hypothetical protein n=1 Tax=Natronorubrum sulfidifaciens TaxID=388259 RepID=UPI0006776165|nr:hypothetical protein [Natronorubrum sulfidifaciens]
MTTILNTALHLVDEDDTRARSAAHAVTSLPGSVADLHVVAATVLEEDGATVEKRFEHGPHPIDSSRLYRRSRLTVSPCVGANEHRWQGAFRKCYGNRDTKVSASGLAE